MTEAFSTLLTLSILAYQVVELHRLQSRVEELEITLSKEIKDVR